jgi:hypothetical protein
MGVCIEVHQEVMITVAEITPPTIPFHSLNNITNYNLKPLENLKLLRDGVKVLLWNRCLGPHRKPRRTPAPHRLIMARRRRPRSNSSSAVTFNHRGRGYIPLAVLPVHK